MLTRRSVMLGGLLAPAVAYGASLFPARNVTIISPYPPGASSDGIARILGERLTGRLGKPVIVENRAGAGGTTGLIALARSDPDGHVLGIGATGALVVNPHIPGSAVAFDPLRELTPIAKLIDIPLILIASRKSGLRSIADIVKASKDRPEGLSYGSTGVNSAQHLSVELLTRVTGAKLVHVAYRGSGPAMTDVLAGQIPLASLDLTAAAPYLASGNIVGVAVTSKDRVAFVPEVPTIAESGFAGFEVPAWMGLFGPANVPGPVVAQLAGEVEAALSDPAVKQKIEQLSCVPAYMPSGEFRDFLKKASADMATLIQSVGQR